GHELPSRLSGFLVLDVGVRVFLLQPFEPGGFSLVLLSLAHAGQLFVLGRLDRPLELLLGERELFVGGVLLLVPGAFGFVGAVALVALVAPGAFNANRPMKQSLGQSGETPL